MCKCSKSQSQTRCTRNRPTAVNITHKMVFELPFNILDSNIIEKNTRYKKLLFGCNIVTCFSHSNTQKLCGNTLYAGKKWEE